MKHRFEVLESHTGGNPTRLIVSGIPELPGDSVAAKAKYFEQNFDWIRTATVLEPRGGNLTSSAVLVPPCDPRADIGIFFMEACGYLPMCGSDTIGLVTSLIETGRIAVPQEFTTVRIDTPAGLIEATARVVNGEVLEVTFLNVTASVTALDLKVDVPDHGVVSVDVAYGGNTYVIAPAASFGVRLEADNTAPAVAVAGRLLEATNAALLAQGLLDPAVGEATHVQLFEPAGHESADATIMVVIQPGIVDRSPCGTGTTAKVASLMQRGEMSIGDEFVHESVTGARFRGKAIDTVDLGSSTGYRVAISGTAYLTGETTMIVDTRDPLQHGFIVR